MLNPHKNHLTTDHTILFRFRQLYITMLILLAVLVTVGQGLTQWLLNTVKDELYVIRFAATQRYQSQQIVKKALQLNNSKERVDFVSNQRELAGIFNSFVRYHVDGQAGRVADYNVRVTNSDTINALYQKVDPHFRAIQASTQAILAFHSASEVNSEPGQANLKILLANEKPFLEKTDDIVRQYVSELRQELTQLQTVEMYVYLFTVAALIAIGTFIFQPAIRKLRQTIEQLVNAEKNTALANKKLMSLNKSLKVTRQKLFDATKQQHQQELNDQKLRAAYLIAGQEEERKRLSRELHDGLGQMLTAIKLQVEGLEASQQLSNTVTLKKLIAQTIQETRSISNNLMPTAFSDFGIVPALKGLTETHRLGSSVEVTLQTNLPATRLDRQVEIMLYRVSQEALSNAFRHGNPTQVIINLFEKDNYLHLIIEDDGQGFRSQRSRAPGGQGIHNMHERVTLLNGKFRLTSTPGKGTKVQVSLPYYSQLAPYESDQTYAR